jgi:hypothetical protein
MKRSSPRKRGPSRWLAPKFDDHPDYFGLPLGALDDDPRIRPKLHTHVASKASSLTITDDLPQIRGETSASAEQN